MPAKIVSFINLKGGVGKTTLALVMGEFLAFGFQPPSKVLLIDLDAQSNLSYALLPETKLEEAWGQEQSIYHMFKAALEDKPWDIDRAIIKQWSNIEGNNRPHAIVCSPDLGQVDGDILIRLEKGEKKQQKPKRKKPEQQEKDELVRLLVREFQEAPDELWSYYPQIAEKVERLAIPKKPSRDAESLFSSYLTEREREFHLNSLRSIVEKFHREGQVSKEEAIKALENTAALRDYAEAFKDPVLAIAQSGLGLSLDTLEEQTISLIRGKASHYSYNLIRGVTLSLTWDGKLIKIAVDPKELTERRKALSLVGCGSDAQPDVARRHDAYLGGILNG